MGHFRLSIYQSDVQLFYLNFHLTGVHFPSELQNTGDVGKQKIKYGPIKTREITHIRLSEELYDFTRVRIHSNKK